MPSAFLLCRGAHTEEHEARLGAAECDDRHGVQVRCHSHPSSPKMFYVSPYQVLEFDGRLIGGLPFALLGILLVR